MPPICPATGHVVEHLYGSHCHEHGVRWFQDCPDCGAGWAVGPARRRSRIVPLHNSVDMIPLMAGPFCANCGRPGPWLGRADLVLWIRHQVQEADRELPPADRVELMHVLDRISEMESSDDKAVPVWKRLHDLAPKVYSRVKPVSDALMSEGVRRALDALLGAG